VRRIIEDATCGAPSGARDGDADQHDDKDRVVDGDWVQLPAEQGETGRAAVLIEFVAVI
jgi:hypothetical protein